MILDVELGVIVVTFCKKDIELRHAETVKVISDENLLSLPELLRYFFMVIDPVSVNRQGNDRGIQYRTGIYFTEMAQLREIRPVYDAEQDKAGQPLAVELQPIKNFYSAEEYHQKYLEKNPDGYCHIPDKYYHMEKTHDDRGTYEDVLRRLDSKIKE